jgi:hypothetical protein
VSVKNGDIQKHWSFKTTDIARDTLIDIIESVSKLDEEHVTAFIELSQFLGFAKRREYERRDDSEE